MGLTGLRPSSGKKDPSTSFKCKFDKKLQFYAKVRDAVVSLGTKNGIKKKKRLRSRQKKLKAYDLSTLSEYLPEVHTSERPQQEFKSKLNGKSRQKLLEKESKQFRAVINHPAFQSEPLAAIHQHLQTTQPLPVSNQEKHSSKIGKKKGKRKPPKVSSAAQSMEI